MATTTAPLKAAVLEGFQSLSLLLDPSLRPYSLCGMVNTYSVCVCTEKSTLAIEDLGQNGSLTRV